MNLLVLVLLVFSIPRLLGSNSSGIVMQVYVQETQECRMQNAFFEQAKKTKPPKSIPRTQCCYYAVKT